MEEFAFNLKKYRTLKGYSCNKLSKLLLDKTGLRVTDKALSNYEHDRREPSFKVLKAIGQVLEVSIDDLFSFKNEETALEIAKIKELEKELSRLKSKTTAGENDD